MPKKPKHSLLCIVAAIVFAGILFACVREISHEDAPQGESTLLVETTPLPTETTPLETTTELYPSAASPTTETVTLRDNVFVTARNAALIAVNGSGNTLLVEKAPDARIYPASLTKIMTLITYLELRAEKTLPDGVVMELSVLEQLWQAGASCAGFQAGEPCRTEDLLYGLMLPSGADAAQMLAISSCGSEAAFVAEMNRLAEKMGLTQTHFTNCTGLHDDNHVSSVQDLGRILAYALRNPQCEKIMSTAEHVTAATTQHMDGLKLKSTVFTRMTGKELVEQGIPITVCGGKTGFTDEAGQCLATWARDDKGKIYLCIVAGCDGEEPMDAVLDTLTLYQYAVLPPAQVKRYELPVAETTAQS